MPSALLTNIISKLPGWEAVLFIIIVVLFLIVGAIISIVILSRMRWPLTYVVLEDVAGKGFSISRKGKCRIIGFGDGGEEVILLKHLNKLRVGYGKRIGPKQIGWVVDSSGLWYQFNFGDFNKTLRELGVYPVSTNVRLGMSAVRKGLKDELLQKSFMEKYGALLFGGLLLICFLLFTAMFWYSTKKNIELASINAESINTSKAAIESAERTLNSVDQILSRINLNAQTPTEIVGGSGIIPNG